MSGIAGFFGPGSRDVLERMIGAIPYRGDTNSVASGEQWGLALRFWQGRPNKAQQVSLASPHVAIAGGFVPAVTDPAKKLRETLGAWQDFGGNVALSTACASLDGGFGGAVWEPSTKTGALIRDPFGIRSLYWLEHDQVLWFATELKQLLQIPNLPIVLDTVAVHKYLTFSFVPGESVPVRGIKRLLPGHVLQWRDGRISIEPYFKLEERLDPQFEDQVVAVSHIRKLAKQAVSQRYLGESEVGLFLSGGIDSSAIGAWLKEAGASVQAFSLDFGAKSVEREYADQAASHLGFPLNWVSVTGNDVERYIDDVVDKLDLPFGDPVTVPQYLLGKAAREAGLTAVFNGEGGDQLFGGWTSKPMIAAAIYGHLVDDASPEEQYLQSWHRFYGLEHRLYQPEFANQIGPPGQRRALLTPHLGEDGPSQFLNRIRLTDIALKGSQNILPRAERMSNAWGLDVRIPLFDRRLAEASFALPTHLKLNGACEKYILKLALKNRLPHELIWRRKFGMSVPVTDWMFEKKTPLSMRIEEVLGDRSVRDRGWFKSDYIQELRSGIDVPSEVRRRRIGERLWTLFILELWTRRFIDRRVQP